MHDHLKIERFYLVGHDWGGPTAFALACAHQAAVRRLAILDVAIPGDGADFSQNGRRWHHALFRTLDLPEKLFEGREHLVINWLFENYGYLPNCIAEVDRQEYLRTYIKPGVGGLSVAWFLSAGGLDRRTFQMPRAPDARKPPSTGSTTPEMYEASSDTRYSTAEAISPVLP